MLLTIASINSGSNGNCYYVGNDTEAVLIDAGISCRETERRMHKMGLSMTKVKAILISHEHGDHIRGLEGICKKHNLPVYITHQTLHHSRLLLPQQLLRSFDAGEAIAIGDLNITAFGKKHDAADAHSFIIQGNDVTIGVFTDLGVVCDNLVHHFKQCHAAFLEANYDVALLEIGRYPIYLKNRIRGGHGHLSNHQALELFKEHRPPHMTHLLLSHLSRDNNDPHLALSMFQPHADGVHVAVASRYEPTGVFKIGGAADHALAEPQTMQASLF